MRALFLGPCVIILMATRIFSHANEDKHPSDVMHRELLSIPSTFSMKIFCDLIFLSIYIYKCIFINLYIYICLYMYTYIWNCFQARYYVKLDHITYMSDILSV